MKIALFHNPNAGNGMSEPSKLRRTLLDAGFDVFYASIKEDGWETTLAKRFDRVVIAGGNGPVNRLALLLARRNIPFCILPLGTANNCARSLGQMRDELSRSTEVVSTGLDCEQSHKSAKSGLEVTCKGDPRVETGDKVPVIVNSEKKS